MADGVARIQHRRVKGFRLPENTVLVARPSRFGNPYKVIQVPHKDGGGAFVWRTEDKRVEHFDTYELALQYCLDAYYRHTRGKALELAAEGVDFFAPLWGKNLACYCPLDKPCHVDMLFLLMSEFGG